MHYHLEIVLPPTDNVETAIAAVMAPFDENSEDEDNKGKAIWDFWVIGGRWSGAKMLAKIGQEAGKEFEAWLQEHHFTVSGVRFGKPELEPPNQAKAVDEEWSRRFPEFAGKCPLFQHSTPGLQ